jgi:hypothetical protein
MLVKQDAATIQFAALMRTEIRAGRDADDCRWILGRIRRGEMRAELLPEESCDEERAACDVPHGQHFGDYLLHYVN